MHRPSPSVLLAVLALAVGCDAGPELLQGPEALRGLDLPTTFDRVASEQGVPRELLLALAWHNTSFDPLDHGDKDMEHAPAYGWLGLSDDQVDQAAALTGLQVQDVQDDPLLNLWAGAALLSELAGPNAAPGAPGADWWPAVTGLAEFDEQWMRDEYALDVFTTIQEGLDVETANGESILFEGRDLPDLEDIDVEEGPMQEEGDFSGGGFGYPGRARYLPAASSNYTHSRSSRIRRIVLHTTEGSYEGAIGWFRNPSANVSAHYVLRRSDGQITQMVRDDQTAWHACSANSDTIGIEHEGRSSVASTWTPANIEASARLVGWLARRYDIPVDRSHIVGHGEVQPSYCAYRYDPGPHFPWAAYMKKVKYYKAHGWNAASTFKPAKIDFQLPKNGQQVGDPFVMQVKRKNAHHLSVYLGARRVKKNVRGGSPTMVIQPRGPGWKRLQVRAYRKDGTEAGRKTIRVRVRTSAVDVDPRARHIDGLDYALTSDLDGSAAYVRYWIQGGSVRDDLTNRLRAQPDDYLFVHGFSSEARRLLVARAYRSDDRLIGEGWRWVTPQDGPGPVVELSQVGADPLVGTTMRLHAEGNSRVAFVKYFVGGEVLQDTDSGESKALPPDFQIYADFDEPGAQVLQARAFDIAGNRRDTVNQTIHAPSLTLEVGWDRTGPRTYRFDADAPAGTERVLFYRGTQLLTDINTGQGFAPGQAFELEHQFATTGAATLSAVARDPVGNVLGAVSFTLAVE